MENHGNIAVFGCDIVYHAVADHDFSAGDVFQSCQQAQGGCFTASRWTDEDKELLVFHVEIYVINSGCIPEFLYNVLVGNTGHGLCLRFGRVW